MLRWKLDGINFANFVEVMSSLMACNGDNCFKSGTIFSIFVENVNWDSSSIKGQGVYNKRS